MLFGVSFLAVSVEHDICRKLGSQDDKLRQELDAIGIAPRNRKQFNTGGNVEHGFFLPVCLKSVVTYVVLKS